MNHLKNTSTTIDKQQLAIDKQKLIESLNPSSPLEHIISQQIANLHLMQQHCVLEYGYKLSIGRGFLCASSHAISTFINSLTKLSNTTANLIMTLEKLRHDNQTIPQKNID
jgi:hypothetical protein